MWLNTTAQNALRAVLYVAEHGTVEPVRVDDIAGALKIPRNYLSKTMHALTRAGVLRSVRGRNGGFLLDGPPHRVVLSDVVGPFQPAGERRCLLGRSTCGDARPCLAHDRWSSVASDIETFFGRTTVADLLNRDSLTPTP